MPTIRTIRRTILPFHPLLGRNVNHDSYSWSYRVSRAVSAQADTLGEMYWPTFADVMDQADIGACPGDAGIEAAYAPPVAASAAVAWPTYTRSQDGAYRLYADATRDDPFAGTWTYPPPGGQDTGSDGLTVAKELRRAGIISGWLNAFTPDEVVGVFAKSGQMAGIPWYNSMFDTAADGQVTVRLDSGLAGGHEIYVYGYLPPVGSSPARVRFRNHWTRSWGDNGDGLLLLADYLRLLAMDGDVIQLIPVVQPAPQPVPVPGDEKVAGDRLAAALPPGWVTGAHVGGNAKAAKAAGRWLKETGRS